MIKEDIHSSNGKIATPSGLERVVSVWQSQPGNWLVRLVVFCALVEEQAYLV